MISNSVWLFNDNSGVERQRCRSWQIFGSGSISFDKGGNGFNCLSKLLVSLLCLYVSGCDFSDRPNQFVKIIKLSPFVDRFEFRSVLNELRPIVVENFRYVAARRSGFYVVIPSIQKHQRVGFSTQLPRGGVSAFGKEMGYDRATNCATNAPANKACNYRNYIWHIITGLMGGLLGGIAGLDLATNGTPAKFKIQTDPLPNFLILKVFRKSLRAKLGDTDFAKRAGGGR
jgi:hypothetical protein